MSNDNLVNEPAKLQATERDSTLNPRQLRKAGFVPATIYGNGASEPRNIQVRTKEFTTLFAHGRRVFDLEGLNVVARAHKLQIDPVSQDVLALEFLELNPNEVQKAMKDVARQREAAEKEALQAEKDAQAAHEAQMKAAAAEDAEAATTTEGQSSEETGDEGEAGTAEAEAEAEPATANS